MTGWDEIQNGWGEIQTPTGGSYLPDLTGNTGKVLTVNAGETGTEWAVGPAPAAAGSDTQVLFNDGGAIAGDAGLTFDKTTNGLSSTGPLTLTPAADIVPLTARAFSSGTNPIAQFQTSANGALSNIGHDGVFNGNVVGNVTGNVSGTSGSTTGNAATATAVASVVASKLVGRGSAAGDGVSQDITVGSGLAMTGTTLSATGGGGGITNSAGANVVVKSDGTNVVASSITDNGTTLTLGNAGVTVTEATGAVALTAQAAGTVPLTVKGAAAQSANLQEWSTSAPAVAASIGPTGKISTLINGGISLVLYDATTGFGRNSSVGGIDFFGNNATAGANYTNPRILFASDNYIAWSVSNVSQAADQILRRRGAANPAWGAAAASPVAYTHSLAADARAGTDTNTGGASATLTPGNGTGTGTASTLIVQTPAVVGSGTGAQTMTTRAIFGPKGINIPGLATYADNTAALAGGLAAGDVYRTSAGVLMVTY